MRKKEDEGVRKKGEEGEEEEERGRRRSTSSSQAVTNVPRDVKTVDSSLKYKKVQPLQIKSLDGKQKKSLTKKLVICLI